MRRHCREHDHESVRTRVVGGFVSRALATQSEKSAPSRALGGVVRDADLDAGCRIDQFARGRIDDAGDGAGVRIDELTRHEVVFTDDESGGDLDELLRVTVEISARQNEIAGRIDRLATRYGEAAEG